MTGTSLDPLPKINAIKSLLVKDSTPLLINLSRGKSSATLQVSMFVFILVQNKKAHLKEMGFSVL
jgi:hypothetical protein